MKENKPKEKKKRPLYKKILRGLGWVFLSLITILILVWILIQLPPVQNFARKKAVSYLQNKIHTQVEIGKLSLDFPTAVSLQNVFLEDQEGDTLLYGDKIKVDISMLRLLVSKVNIREVSLDGIVGKIKRQSPDSVFNFQYIVDAFASKEDAKTRKKEESTPMEININAIVVNSSHIIYKDDYTGNDLNLNIGHFKTQIKTFDISHLLFDISTIEADHVRGHFYQLEPLQKEVKDVIAETSQEEDKYLQIINKEIKLSDINFEFNSDASHLKSSYIIGKATLHPEKLDVKNMLFAIKDASLEDSHIKIATNSSLPNKSAKDTISAAPPPPGITVLAKTIAIKNSSFKLDDESKPRIPEGMDYAHLFLTDITLKGKDLKYSGDTTHAILTSATLKEQSGFVLNNMQIEFTMTSTGISLENMMIKTPGSLLQKSVSIRYPSLDALSKDPGLLGLDIDLEKSRLSVKDLLLFLPESGKQLSLSPDEIVFADTRITGTLRNMKIERLSLQGFSSTNVDLKGTIRGLPDPKKIYADLDIHQFQTSKKDIAALMPPNTLPSNITLPDRLALAGTFRGDMEKLNTDLQLSSSLGNATIKGTASHVTDKNAATYDLQMHASEVQLNRILQNPELGMLTGSVDIKGAGLDPKTARATFRVSLPVVNYHQYAYRNILASGKIADAQYQLKTSVQDPNVAVSMNADGEFKGTYPTLHLEGIIDSIRTLPLHLTEDVLKYHGRIYADFSNLNPDSLNGKLLVTKSILFSKEKRMALDTVQLIVGSGAKDSLILLSAPASFALRGKFKLRQLGTIFQQAIDPYFSISTLADTTNIEPYHFTMQGNLSDNPALKTFLPELRKMKPVNIQGKFSSDSGWSIAMEAPHVNYDSMVINDIKFRAGTTDSALAFTASMGRLHSGKSIDVYETRMEGTVANNKLDFALNIRDALDKNKYHLAGKFQKSDTADYVFSLKPDSLVLNYDDWKVLADNAITYKKGNINASNFTLSREGQELSLQSEGNSPKNPLRISFTDFKLATLTGFVQPDSSKINGLLNGNALVQNLATDPVFTADLTISDLSMYQDTLGNITAKVDNKTDNQYHAEISLKGRGNDLQIKGDYFTKPSGSSFDFVANLDRFQIKSLEGLTQKAIRDGQGYVFGKVSVKGTTKKPEIDGNIKFHNTSFVPAALNSVFKIDKEAVAIVNNKGILLQTFTIQDAQNNKLVLMGSVLTDDWMNYRFNLGIRADHFQAINSTEKDNDLFYGKMIFSTNLRIKGTPTHPIVDGSLVINDNTEFTIVLPQEEPGIAHRKGIVRFVDYSATSEDSLFMAPYDSLAQAPLIGYDVSLNISIDKKAAFSVIVDAANGDFLHLKGTGELTGGIDASGKVTLVGTYEIEEGSYSLSFNFIQRKFLIQEGSNITWTGDPTTAKMDVTAVYVANTAPFNLVQDMMESTPVTFKQKLPFNVNLHMEGELLKPVISFDIILPEEKNYLVGANVISSVRDRLIQLRQEPSEMNKQVFALLLLNRFVGQNPFESGSGGMSATTFAKQSVSRLLTEQLNNLTEGLIEGVDINFDLATTEDYTTGTKKDRTDLNVGVTKNLLNDRLSVTVGSNFELEGPQATKGSQSNLAGNISINYKLSKDGRYMLRAYRQNNYTGIVEGYIVETGLAFVITLDYNKLKNIFKSKEERVKKREIRKRNRQMEDPNEEKTSTESSS